MNRKLLFTFFYVIALSVFSVAQNAIVTENGNPGNPISEWGVPDFRDIRIAGFANKMSLNHGETVRFRISVQSNANYTLKIYRIGYYGGDGARLMANLGSLNGITQTNGISNPATGILDCGNWTESASWVIPTNAVSGFYIAKIERNGGGSNHIAFIVRNDESNSDMYLQLPDATWQAYNGYGGNSVYDGNTSGFPSGHAAKVSYNRPFFPYNSLFNTEGREADWYMNAEYPMIRWLERNGYDVTYTSCNDVDRNGSRLLNHKVFISLGHDEYWSKKQRDNVEAARNAGVHLAFFSGNEVYWKTRWENNDGTEDRTLVCYKEGLLGDGTQGERTCGSKCDPSPEWTGLWRTGGNYDAGKPENSLVGQISWVEYPSEIGVPAFYKKIRFWRNSSIPNLPAGQSASLGVNTLGYEWDYEQPQYASSNPPGRFTMSSKTVNSLTHKLSLYRHSSGALVFGAGTVQWSWGLDGEHWGGTTTVSKEMQQATVNLFADMNVQPGKLQTDLAQAVLSTDFILPITTITSPLNNSSFLSGSTITIAGTATDGGGGVVAAVEISTDGGATWKSADISAPDGNITWSYTWATTSNGTFNIRYRGVDDSGNIENAGPGINVTVGTSDNTAPTVVAVSPAIGSTGTGINTTVTANFNETINASTVTGSTFQLRDAGNNLIAATVSISSNQIILTPTASLTASTVYTATIKGGVSGVKDLSGNALVSDYSWSFTTVTVTGVCPCTVFQPADAPLTGNSNDEQGIALGMRFRSVQNGFITGVRYYKGAGATGTHTGSLWTNTGTLLAQATFTSETASGWQQVLFSNPVAISADVTYVVSYFSPSGDYIATKPYFTQAVVNGPLRGLADGEDGANGLYMYSAIPAFPSSSFQSSHYWVDVVFNTTAGSDITPPVVTSVSPLSGATGVSINTTITANFTEDINASSVTGTTFQLRDAGNNIVPATISSSFKQITLTPLAALSASTLYTVKIQGGASGVKDAAGNALVNDFVWSFTTAAADITAPTVISVLPVNGATGVVVNTTVSANFNEAISASTVTGATFQLRDAGNNLVAATVSASANQITLTPTAALTASTEYTVTIKGGNSGVKDLSGNALVNDYSWSFTTGVASICPCTVFQPGDAPSQTTNSNDEQGIALGMRFRSAQNGFVTGVRYYKATGATGTHTGSLWTNTGTLLAQANFINETVSGWQQVLFSSPVAITAGTTYVISYFSPSGDYVATKPYFTQAVVNGPLRGLADGEDGANGLYMYSAATAFPTNSFQSSHYWVDVVFNTSVAGSDVTAPIVTSVSPANAATGIAINASVSAIFSEELNAATISSTTFQLRNAANVLIPATVTYNSITNTATLTASASLSNSTVYTATITGGAAGVKDAAGNALVNNYVWSFTTVAAADITPPTVTSVSPASTATDVLIATNVSAIFSEALDAATISSSTFQLRNAANVLIPATVTFNATTNTATLTPSASLSNSAVYTATITGGASGVKDAAGNALVNNYTWTFTTAASNSDVTPPTVLYVVPSNGTTGTDLNTTVLAGFNEAMTASTINTTTVQLRNSSNVLIAATVIYNVSGNTFTLTPLSPLTNSTVYTATITGGAAGVKDAAGNALVNNYSWSFTTVADNIMPTVVSVIPVTGTSNVSVNTPITAVFSETMNATTINATTFEMRNTVNNTVIPVSVVYDAATRTAAITYTGSLAYSITYSVTAKGGSSGIKDAAGNSLANDYTWAFITSSGTLVPPTVTTEPLSQTICPATIVSFTSAASGSPAPTVQWQESTNGTTWTNIIGATNSTLTFTVAVTDNNKKYRAVWTNSSSVNSSPATLTVNSVPAAPTVTVINNCGSSILTAGAFTGSLLWSNNATASSVTVTTAGVYTVTQTVNGCKSPAASGTAAPKPVPSLTSNLTATYNTGVSFVYVPVSSVSGTTFTWSRAAVTGISNSARTGSGNISEALTNTTLFPVTVTYIYTLTANGCTNTQNLLVTINPEPTVNCKINGSLTSSFTSTAIPAGRYIWFSSVLNRGLILGVSPVNIIITNSKITFTANNQQYTLSVPNASITYDLLALSASTQFVNNAWTTKVPRTYGDNVFMTGLSYLVPVNFPGGITNVKWTADISVDQTGVSLTWKWAASVYTRFATHSGLNIKPIDGLLQNPYLNTDKAGTPENYKSYLVSGGKGSGGSNYTGNYSSSSSSTTCSTAGQRASAEPVITQKSSLRQLPDLLLEKMANGKLDADVMPNPSATSFTMMIKGSNESPVTVRIIDIFGQVVERHDKIGANTVLKLGHKWTSGSYFAEVTQGNQKKIVRIIKAR